MKDYPGVSLMKVCYKVRRGPREGREIVYRYYKSRIMVDGRSIILGFYKTKEAAAAAYRKAKAERG